MTARKRCIIMHSISGTDDITLFLSVVLSGTEVALADYLLNLS